MRIGDRETGETGDGSVSPFSEKGDTEPSPVSPVSPERKFMFRLTEEEFRIILDFKRDLHMHPELSQKEFRTTERIRDFLKGLPSCRILPVPVETGVVAVIKGKKEDPEIMLRADIDALPQTEEYESEWKSQNPGIMHACGHDFHTASLLGAALILNRMQQEGKLEGTVDLVFQPAEEGTTGARMLLNAGLFDFIHPAYCFGMHNWPSVESGNIVCHQGALMAAKRNFEIRLFGAGGHGSMPHLNIDPIVCAAAVVQSLQTVVSRNIDPLDSVVLSINQIEGGSPVNLVVDQVSMKATIRSLSEEALDRAIQRTETIVKSTAAAYECRSEIIWKERIPAVYNSSEMTTAARKCAEKTGCRIVDAPPSLASEDFALYRSNVPSFFYWVGSRTPGETCIEELHRPRFHTDDAALRYAAELYAASAI